MKIKTGYLYHIKDEYFDVVNDENLMQNHEKGKKRPTYFLLKIMFKEINKWLNNSFYLISILIHPEWDSGTNTIKCVKNRIGSSSKNANVERTIRFFFWTKDCLIFNV